MLIIGKIPPPVGGVTIHVSRLTATLTKQNFPGFEFFDLGKNGVLKLFLILHQYKGAHLHTSNPYFQLIVALFCRLVKTRLIITYHGNWGRYAIIKNLATSISSWLTFIPILQNEGSFLQSRKLNKRSALISAFIPPLDISPLTPEILRDLQHHRECNRYIFCTNASNFSLDKDGKEIYGISDLIKKFFKMPNSALIVSDPSGNNRKHLTDTTSEMPDNVHVITEKHDFWNILQCSDAFIRNTTTDGDSISLREAICSGTTVFATECVPRPAGCNLYADISEINFEKELVLKKSSHERKMPDQQADAVAAILIEYGKCLV